MAGIDVELALEGVQLLHEVEVRRNIRLSRPHQRERIVEAQRPREHDVGQGDRHRPGHSRQAVDQHTGTL